MSEVLQGEQMKRERWNKHEKNGFSKRESELCVAAGKRKTLNGMRQQVTGFKLFIKKVNTSFRVDKLSIYLKISSCSISDPADEAS